MSFSDNSKLFATKVADDVIQRLSIRYGFDAKEATKLVYESQLEINVSDIEHFFVSSTRNDNDVINKVRETILETIVTQTDYFEHPKYGPSWCMVRDAWRDALKRIADETSVQGYTSIRCKKKGGRGSYYDFEVSYYNETLIATRQIEFKYGTNDITKLPQILSLQAKFKLFPETYDTFYYDNYIDPYCACDSGITVVKPSRQQYLKYVTSISASKIKDPSCDFFAQLKQREGFFKREKNEVVNSSIEDYLTKYSKYIDLKMLYEKIKDTQSQKQYLLWCDGKFCYDTVVVSDMKFHSIKNKNSIVIQSGNTAYSMLLRWRNHKGILNPAWQISIKRV
jgi:hypothetical protein